ncbi:MAG: YecR-like lipofamily protein [Prevotellaceae bacterium]|jgi:hypothetical protein|nr:YecR-like lipofamily protein [Prevotellaceae bacterium]
MKKNFKFSTSILAILFLFPACKVQKNLSVYDGSKADGTITMFYTYGAFERPTVNWEAAKKEAIARCKNWGYNGAEFFNGTKTCLRYSVGSCDEWRVTYKCQCTD